MKRFIFPLFFFVILIVFLGIGLHLKPAEVPSPLIGKPVPEFKLTRLQEPDKLISTQDLSGQVWLLNVWASWCTACREEHAALLAFSRSASVLIIGLDYKDKRQDAIAWLNRLGNPYFISAFDEEGRVGIDFGVYGVPETFVIDKRGMIRLKLIGPVTQTVIAEKLLPLLKELNDA